MLNTLLGKKIGMTQIFNESGIVVPVTVVNIARWVVTQIKTVEKDGYSALQVGWLRQRFDTKNFSPDWLKKKKQYFSSVREIQMEASAENLIVGQEITLENIKWSLGQKVQVTGRSKGLGFQGVTKRWRFGRGPSTHGSKFHRRPGSMGFMRSQGKVIKGKKLPGHFGNEQTTVQGLRLIQTDAQMQCVFIKGALPGKKDSVVLIKKQG